MPHIDEFFIATTMAAAGSGVAVALRPGPLPAAVPEAETGRVSAPLLQPHARKESQ